MSTPAVSRRQVAFLRDRYDADERTANADKRHWSEIPDYLFSAQRARADVAAKRAALDALARCADHSWVGSWAVVTVAREAIAALVQPYSDTERNPGFEPSWLADLSRSDTPT